MGGQELDWGWNLNWVVEVILELWMHCMIPSSEMG